jgi:hypothetical protein
MPWVTIANAAEDTSFILFFLELGKTIPFGETGVSTPGCSALVDIRPITGPAETQLQTRTRTKRDNYAKRSWVAASRVTANFLKLRFGHNFLMPKIGNSRDLIVWER